MQEVSGEDRQMDVPFDPMGEGAWGRARAGTSWLVVRSVIPPLRSGFGNAQQSLACDSSFSLAAPRLPQWNQHFGILVSVTWGLGGHSELLQLSPDSTGCPVMLLAIGQCRGSQQLPHTCCVPVCHWSPCACHTCSLTLVLLARNEVTSADCFWVTSLDTLCLQSVILFHCKICLYGFPDAIRVSVCSSDPETC